METKRGTTFVVMPFEEEYANIYEFVIKGACDECNVFFQRLDEQIITQSMLTQIHTQIVKADFIIAVMSGKNPNVFYEVGYARGKNKKVILITDDIAGTPFDFKHYQHIIYNKNNLKDLKQKLKERLQFFIGANNKTNTDFNGDKLIENTQYKIELNMDDDSVRAALAISGVINFRERVQKTFRDTILPLVKISFPNVIMSNNNYGYDWYYMEIPVREGNYLLQVNYDWTSAWLVASASCKIDSASQEWTNLNKKMEALFGFERESVPTERLVWSGEDISWPSLESYINNDERELYLAHLSKLSPEEVADKIISIAKALESVKA